MSTFSEKKESEIPPKPVWLKEVQVGYDSVVSSVN